MVLLRKEDHRIKISAVETLLIMIMLIGRCSKMKRNNQPTKTIMPEYWKVNIVAEIPEKKWQWIDQRGGLNHRVRY